MICARYFYNIFRRVHTMQYHLKTPYEWFNLHNFPCEENPPSTGLAHCAISISYAIYLKAILYIQKLGSS